MQLAEHPVNLDQRVDRISVHRQPVEHGEADAVIEDRFHPRHRLAQRRQIVVVGAPLQHLQRVILDQPGERSNFPGGRVGQRDAPVSPGDVRCEPAHPPRGRIAQHADLVAAIEVFHVDLHFAVLVHSYVSPAESSGGDFDLSPCKRS